MTAKPSFIPKFAQAGSITEPSTTKKQSGWVQGEKPDPTFWNWLWYWTSLWCQWLANIPAADLPITDALNLHTATDVEGALQEDMQLVRNFQQDSSIPAGTKMIFYNTTPPAGWVIDTSVTYPSPALLVITNNNPSFGGNIQNGDEFYYHRHRTLSETDHWLPVEMGLWRYTALANLKYCPLDSAPPSDGSPYLEFSTASSGSTIATTNRFDLGTLTTGSTYLSYITFIPCVKQ
jgi:hypothetical protein